jgi:hypothetical protein
MTASTAVAGSGTHRAGPAAGCSAGPASASQYPGTAGPASDTGRGSPSAGQLGK